MKLAIAAILLAVGVAACEPITFDFTRTNGNQHDDASDVVE
jgi:hypothetical protein